MITRLTLSIVVGALFVLVGCTKPNSQSTTIKPPASEPLFVSKIDPDIHPAQPETVDIGEGFLVRAAHSEDYGRFKVYWDIVLLHDGAEVYSDTSNEYEFCSTQFPRVRRLTSNGFEILLTVNDRPNKNKLLLLRVKEDQVFRSVELPDFLSGAKDLAGDGKLRLAGLWDYSEVWESDDGNPVTDYNPILYYVQSDTGLYLDSAYTRSKNQTIFGTFLGFQFSEQHPVLRSLCDSAFARELKRIQDTTSAP